MDFNWITNNAVAAFGFVFIAVAIILIIREIVTWYWKINETIDLLEDIEGNTAKTNILLEKIISKTQEPRKAPSET